MAEYFRRVIHISATDSPNVQLAQRELTMGLEPSGKEVLPGVLTWAEYQHRLATWDEERICVGVRGEFYLGKKLFLFPAEWLDLAERNWALIASSSRRALTMGCLPDGEIVLTGRGLKCIENVESDDVLIDHEGNPTEILRIYRRPYNGTVYNIRPAFSSRATRFTDEHPLMVLKDRNLKHSYPGNQHVRYYDTAVKWKRADQVVVGDIIKFPIRYKTELSNDELLSKFPALGNKSYQQRGIKHEVILEEDFWFFVGLWLAEGWLRCAGERELNDIELSLCLAEEGDLTMKVIGIVQRLFNRKPVLRCRVERNTIEMKFASQQMSDFLRDNFGQKAAGKNVAEWVKCLPKRLKVCLFEGYLTGDGCITDDKGNETIECVSVSERLLCDFQEMLLSLGVLSSISLLRSARETVICGKSSCQKETFHLRIAARDTVDIFTQMGWACDNRFERARHKGYGWIEGDYLYAKVQSVIAEQYDGFVNNFHTESHSYCVVGMTTHNCDPAEGGDSSSWCVIDDLGVIELRSEKTPDTTDVTEITVEMIEKHNLDPSRVIFDTGGGGKEHADRMRKDGWPVRSVGFGAGVSLDPKRGLRMIEEKIDVKEDAYAYVNRRAEMYSELSQLLDPALNRAMDRPGFALPAGVTTGLLCPIHKGQCLRAQLEPIPKDRDAEGRLKLPPKNKRDATSKEKCIVDMVGHSPDESDALALAVHAMLHEKRRAVAGAF